MTYYFWLGIDAEPFHDAHEYLEQVIEHIEADGFITIHPKIQAPPSQ